MALQVKPSRVDPHSQAPGVPTFFPAMKPRLSKVAE